MLLYLTLHIPREKKRKNEFSCSQQLLLELTLPIAAPGAKQKCFVFMELIIVGEKKKITYFSAKTTSEDVILFPEEHRKVEGEVFVAD